MGFGEVEQANYVFKKISSIDIELIEDFSCGSEELDKKLYQMKENDEGTTLIFLDKANNCIIGYCTYCTSGLKMSYENDSVTHSAAEIKYFAINESYQHKSYNEECNFSDWMLLMIISRLFEISNNIIDFDYILLYSVPDAKHFYEKNGFMDFNEYMDKDSYRYIDGCIPMFLKL